MREKPLIAPCLALAVLQQGVPDWQWMLEKIETEDGCTRLPQILNRLVANHGIERYPLLYRHDETFITAMLQGMASREQMHGMRTDSEHPERSGHEEVVRKIVEQLTWPSIPKTEREHSRARQQFLQLSSADQKAASAAAQRFYGFFFASFFQHVSLIAFGKKLTTLVGNAQAGDDQAFAQAVRIDRRILAVLPYFKHRAKRAQDESDERFPNLPTGRVNRPPYSGTIQHKSLWLKFALLEGAGLLRTLGHLEVMRFCNERKSRARQIQGVNQVAEHLGTYMAFQGSKHEFPFCLARSADPAAIHLAR